MRRAGVTLVEMIFASAVLAVVLLMAYGTLQDGLRGSVDLGRTELADAMGRNLLERFESLPPGELARLFAERPTQSLAELADPILSGLDPETRQRMEALGMEQTLSYRPTDDRWDAGQLRAEVSWRGPDGQRRVLRHDRQVFGQERMVEEFRRVTQLDSPHSLSGWGSSRTWETSIEKGERRSTAETNEYLLRRVSAQRGRDLVHVSPPEDERVEDPPLAFHDPTGAAAAIFGPTGALSRTLVVPTAPTSGAGSVEQRFLARTGLPHLGTPSGRVPDGRYPYRLDAVDLRADPTTPRVVGVLTLRGPGREYLLLAERRLRPAVRWLMEGDDVLERAVVRDAEGHPWRLSRTDARLYLVCLADDPALRDVVVHTLAQIDQGAEASEWTRTEREGWLGELGMVPAELEVEDELLASVPGAPPPGEGVQAFRSLAGRGGRILEARVRTVPVRFVGHAPPPGVATSSGEGAGADGSGGSGTSPGTDPSGAGGSEGEAAAATKPDRWARAEMWRVLQEDAGSDPAGVLPRLEEFLGHFPEDAAAHALKGDVLRKLDRNREAIDAWREASEKAAEPDPALLMRMADLLVREKRLEEAAQVLAELAEARPDDAQVKRFQRAVARELEVTGR